MLLNDIISFQKYKRNFYRGVKEKSMKILKM